MMFARDIVQDIKEKSVGSAFFVALYSLTLFVSASLMFTVQPMVGKILLPLFGGAPSTWLAAMAYFQVALLAGYFLAYLLSRFAPRYHMLVVCGLLAAGLSVLPFHFDRQDIEIGAGLSGAFTVVTILFGALTLPFLGIASLSPTLQRLFGASVKQDPYFLFAASNFGSFAGLLAYPFLIERFSGLHFQVMTWRLGFGALLVLCLACLALSWRQDKGQGERVLPSAVDKISWRQRAVWVLLAFVPSSLMLGVTAHVTSEVVAIPLFWVVPLALYLLTFVLAFAQNGARNKRTYETLGWAQPMAVALLIVPMLRAEGMGGNIMVLVLSLAVFYMTARYFHGLLADCRPGVGRLTEYYLWLSVGGASGGIFNTFLAPFIFSTPIEFTLLTFLTLLIPPFFRGEQKLGLNRTMWGATLIALAIGFTFPLAGLAVQADSLLVKMLHIGLLLSLAMLAARPLVMALVILIVAVLLAGGGAATQQKEVVRNFFGVERVTEVEDSGLTVRRIVHGNTVHGQQAIKPTLSSVPNGYYAALKDIMETYAPKNVGIVGLGAGTTVCYVAPDRRYTVYEIDPDMIALAHRWFTFMRDCGEPTLRVGDGRKLLEKDRDAAYDLLTIDAFSSDAIPVHLLTREAIQLDLDRMAPDGVLALHVSNRYFDLVPPIANIARALGLHGLTRLYVPKKDEAALNSVSQWVVLARDSKRLESLRASGWENLPEAYGRVWTDDYSDMISAFALKRMMRTNAQTY